MKKLISILLIVALCIPVLLAAKPAPIPTKKATINNQYGGAPFDPDQIYGSEKINVFEKGNYTIVYWAVSDLFTKETIYMSVAKKDKWIVRGKEVFTVPASPDVKFEYSHDHLFYTSQAGLNVVVFNLNNGNIVSNELIQKYDEGSSYTDAKVLSRIKTNDNSGIVFGLSKKGEYNIYLEKNTLKPIAFKDPKALLPKRLITADLILTTNRDQIIMNELGKVSLFTIKKKDVSYDKKGKETFYLKAEGKAIKKYFGGKFYVYNGTELNVYDENFKKLQSYLFNKLDKKMEFNNVTFRGSSIRIWNYHNYKNTNSLQLVTLKFGK
ncbi:hypothetical protein I6N90_24390 [Paenibacillus sp. GSMTC-2017]|uniref:hypothetical protein n=1 Tax=Paenibacillus sp. GSMTC-2017 TaxID=2794350 RepID=UPI0018D848C5|nr:hypothetical protein [Paenibacillus sp. GSMTC-2017]MBH5320929.1 hypothetical protein [Paenibacillus sp. GSMTC-2017]